MHWLGFAGIFSVCLASYHVVIKLTEAKISPALGTLVMTAVSLVIVGLYFMFVKSSGATQFSTKEGLVFAAISGVIIALTDIVAYEMYNAGAPVSTASPLTSVAAIILAFIAGVLFLQEGITITKLLGLGLGSLGVILLFRG